jgi:tRNA pseudouridine38-40 synthase
MRLRLDVAYDGTDFAGWAPQPDQRTVAGVLAAHLVRLFGVADGLTVAGRTDAGVHASGQVCHVDVPAEAWERVATSAVRRLAGLLPGDVRVLSIGLAPPGFDARFSALWRRYEYRVTDAAPGPAPLDRRCVLGWPRSLDLAALQEAARALLGEHDFAAYCRRKEHGTTVRALQRLDWRREPTGILVATVQADAFCQAMVRSLIGALLPVGDGRRPIDWPGGLLARRERASEVTVVPPHGLTLVEVGYPVTGHASRAELTRRLRDSPLG